MHQNKAVIVVAGGSGQRMGGELPKQFMPLNQIPILVHTLNAFTEAVPGAQLVVVMHADYIQFWKEMSAQFHAPNHEVVAGGEERFFSVRNGLAALTSSIEYVAVHDAVRPFVSKQVILNCFASAKVHRAVVPVIDEVDSVREVVENENRAIDRSSIKRVQTPQCFERIMLTHAYQQDFSKLFTDDASVVESNGHSVFLVEGNKENIKITTPFDLTVARAIMEKNYE